MAAMWLGGCLSTPPAPGGDGAPGGRDDARPAPADPRIGDLLTYTFDDAPGQGLVRDRSGSHRHGDGGDSRPGAGEVGSAYGESRVTSPGGGLGLFLLRDPGLVPGGGLTVEAWVYPSTPGAFAVFGNFLPGATPPVDYSFEVTDDARLRLVTSADEQTTVEATAASGEVLLDSWTHVAASWDGAEVTFYIDGAEVDRQPLAAPPVQATSSERFAVGQRPGGSLGLNGGLDELKVSSYAKTGAEIALSRDFDSTSLVAGCADAFIEQGETCLAEGLCCDDACQPEVKDDACGGGCEAGRCVSAMAGRVEIGLQALYVFDSGAAGDESTVPDVSGLQPPMDLTIADVAAVERLGGFLRISGSTVLEAATSTSLHTGCTASGEVTIEAWARPAALQEGPARLAAFSAGVNAQTFVLGQEVETWVLRLRQSGGTAGGKPGLASAQGDAEVGKLTHVVVTAAAGGDRRFYVDGRLRDLALTPGDFSGWDSSHVFRVANEGGLERPWLGDLHLVALYCRVLDDSEVAQNFGAGPDPELN